MLSISKQANPNYLAKVVKIENLRKHENADRLQVAVIDFNDVITGMDTKVGDLVVYFPVESQIHFEFLKHTNQFASQLLNEDTTIKGYFDKNGRVRAVKLRGEKSMGYIVPLLVVEEFTGKFKNDEIGMEFDTINDILMVKKYELPIKGMNNDNKLGKKPRISKLVEGQVLLHVDTTNLRKEAFKIKPDYFVSITNKLHGTSFHVHNVIVKKKSNIFTKLIGKLFDINKTEYDIIYGSRKVIKNQYETQNINDFYDGDLYAEIKEELKDKIPKNWNIYGECVGFTKTGGAIQSGYDYGCKPDEHKIFIYRITTVNPDGFIQELSTLQIKEFCDKMGLNYVPLYYVGYAKNIYPELSLDEHWNEELIKRLEEQYATGDCDMCLKKVPKEGMVLRVESLMWFESYKLKSFDFLAYETSQLDKGEADMESAN